MEQWQGNLRYGQFSFTLGCYMIHTPADHPDVGAPQTAEGLSKTNVAVESPRVAANVGRLQYSMRTLALAALLVPPAIGLLGPKAYRYGMDAYHEVTDLDGYRTRKHVAEQFEKMEAGQGQGTPFDQLLTASILWGDIRSGAAAGDIDAVLGGYCEQPLPTREQLGQWTKEAVERALDQAARDDSLLHVWKVVKHAQMSCDCAGLNFRELSGGDENVREVLLRGARRSLASAVGTLSSGDRESSLDALGRNLQQLDIQRLPWSWDEIPLSEADLRGLGMTRQDLLAQPGVTKPGVATRLVPGVPPTATLSLGPQAPGSGDATGR